MTIRRTGRLTAVAGTFALAAAALAAAPNATADQAARAPGRVVAHGLNSPRLISVGPAGALYVAEAGTGGKGPCVVGGDGSKSCFGMTGSVTRIHRGHQHRVLRHLPSLAGAGEAIGPAELVTLPGHRYALSTGAGIDLHARHTLPRRGQMLGTISTGRFGHRPHLFADIVRFEWRHNPDNSVAHDSDPTGLVRAHRGFTLADAGGNDLLRARMRHHRVHVHAAAVLPDRMVPFPPEAGGGKGPMQAVPTAVAVGPGGAYYFSQLTGFPFPPGAARIYRMVPGHRAHVYASGLTNVTDLAWHRHRLYAVQLANSGLLAAGAGLPTGSLVRVHRGFNRNLHMVASFPAPYGVAFRGDHAFVTTCSVCTGGGTVASVRVR
ncbi:MAG: ScyD/ScyE family protein [Marmoricola sp.]